MEGTNDISGTAKARVVKFCTQVGYVNSKHVDDTSPSEGAYVIHFYRANYASTILAVIVCSPVCLSQVGVVQRRLNLESHS